MVGVAVDEQTVDHDTPAISSKRLVIVQLAVAPSMIVAGLPDGVSHGFASQSGFKMIVLVIDVSLDASAGDDVYVSTYVCVAVAVTAVKAGGLKVSVAVERVIHVDVVVSAIVAVVGEVTDAHTVDQDVPAPSTSSKFATAQVVAVAGASVTSVGMPEGTVHNLASQSGFSVIEWV